MVWSKKSRMKFAGKCRADQNAEEGSGALEVCVLLPIFILILAAGTDLAFLCQKYLLLADSASAGARYGSSGNSNDTNGMVAAAQNAAGGISGFTASAASFCSCSPGGSQISCSGTCESQTSPVQYVQVNAKAPSTFPFATGTPGSVQLSNVATIRVSGATH